MKPPLSPQQFYHGSPHHFAPGDLITPPSEGHDTENTSSQESSDALRNTGTGITRSLNQRIAAHDDEARHNVFFTNDKTQARSYGQGTGYYRVEPQGPYETDPDSGGEYAGYYAYRSTQPLKVLGHVK